MHLVVNDGVMDEASSVGESEGHFLSETLQVDGGKGLEVGLDLRFVGGTLQDALPNGSVRFRAVAEFMINWACKEMRRFQLS